MNLVQNPPIPCPSAGLIAHSLGPLLHFLTYRMRVLHQILNSLTNDPKHDYRGIRGNRTGRKLGPDSEYQGCKQRFRGAVNDRIGIETN